MHPCAGVLVHFDDDLIAAADDEQCWRFNMRECGIGKIGTPAPRNHGTYARRAQSRRNKCGTTPRTRSEKTNGKIGGLVFRFEPIDRRHEASCKQLYVK